MSDPDSLHWSAFRDRVKAANTISEVDAIVRMRPGSQRVGDHLYSCLEALLFHDIAPTVDTINHDERELYLDLVRRLLNEPLANQGMLEKLETALLTSMPSIGTAAVDPEAELSDNDR